MGANGRRKGKAGELELAAVLREAGYGRARRGQQRSGRDTSDVIGGPAGVHLEVKRVERLDLRSACEQAERDAPPGQLPVVVHRVNGAPWRVTLRLDAFLDLLQAAGRGPTVDDLVGDEPEALPAPPAAGIVRLHA